MTDFTTYITLIFFEMTIRRNMIWLAATIAHLRALIVIITLVTNLTLTIPAFSVHALVVCYKIDGLLGT